MVWMSLESYGLTVLSSLQKVTFLLYRIVKKVVSFVLVRGVSYVLWYPYDPLQIKSSFFLSYIGYVYWFEGFHMKIQEDLCVAI